MSKRRSSFCSGLFLIWILFLVPWHGCGGGAPPASIPAPVSTLGMVVSPSDGGLVAVSGAAGSAVGGATVVATNIGPGAHFWEDFLVKKAFAQIGSRVQVIANPDGSFFLEIPAFDTDVIEIFQEVAGEQSDPIDVTVPCGGAFPAC